MEIYFEGTKIELITIYDGRHEKECYMLCETHEIDKAFQIICISGYNSGKLVGYINNQKETMQKGYKAVDQLFLLNEIERNIKFVPGSLKLIK